MSPVDLTVALAAVNQYWSPAVVARLNDYEIKVVKLAGEFLWHSHQDTDELFLVLSGQLRIELRDGHVELTAGQLHVVGRGIEHRPVSTGETHVVLIEPAGVVNTGTTGTP